MCTTCLCCFILQNLRRGHQLCLFALSPCMAFLACRLCRPVSRVPAAYVPTLKLAFTPTLVAEYLVVITGRAPIRRRINGHAIYHATEFRVLPVATPTSNHLIDHPVEKHLVDLIEKHLADSVLWFSYGFDLTRNLQSQTLNPANGKPMWEMVRTTAIFLLPSFLG